MSKRPAPRGGEQPKRDSGHRALRSVGIRSRNGASTSTRRALRRPAPARDDRRALSCSALLIADEPTTAWTSRPRQILDCWRKIQQDADAIMLITHNLGVARWPTTCRHVLGRVVRKARRRDLSRCQASVHRALRSRSEHRVGAAGEAATITGDSPVQPSAAVRSSRAPRSTGRCDKDDRSCWTSAQSQGELLLYQ